MSLYYRTVVIQGRSTFVNLMIRATTLGFTLPVIATQNALEDLLDSWDSQGLTPKMDYLRIGAYNDVNCLNFSRINIANPISTLTVYTGAITYTTSGVISGATANSQATYVNTGISLGLGTTKYAIGNATRVYVIYQSGVPTNGLGYVLDGVVASDTTAWFTSTNTFKRLHGFQGFNTAVDMTGTGLRALTKNAAGTSSSNNFYTIGATRTGITMAGTATNVSGVQSEFASNAARTNNMGISLSLYGSYLTDIEVEFVRTSYNTYLTAIGLSAIA